MLPDPKKVANAIRGLWTSSEERRQEAEMDRSVQLKLAKSRLHRHVVHQKEICGRLMLMAKRAISLNDDANFKQIGRQLIWTKKDIQRWERYLLTLEMLETRHDQVKASLDLISAVKSMSESLTDLAAPGKLGELQKDLEKGLAKAANLEQQMEVMMDIMDSTLTGDMQVESDDLKELEMSIADEVALEEASAFDPEIEQLRQKIRKEMSNSGNG